MKVSEVPFEFGHRHDGESKASSRELYRLFRHMAMLHVSALAPLLRFLFVGASGLIVNTFLLALFTEIMGFHYMVSAVAATQVSVPLSRPTSIVERRSSLPSAPGMTMPNFDSPDRMSD